MSFTFTAHSLTNHSIQTPVDIPNSPIEQPKSYYTHLPTITTHDKNTKSIVQHQRAQDLLDHEEYWIWGYGSLLWRPGFSYIERRLAFLPGWARRCWQSSDDHRGTSCKHGLVVTALPNDHVDLYSPTITPHTNNKIISEEEYHHLLKEKLSGEIDNFTQLSLEKQSLLLQEYKNEYRSKSLQSNSNPTKVTYSKINPDRTVSIESIDNTPENSDFIKQTSFYQHHDRCWGVAYRLAKEDVAEIVNYLDHREQNGYSCLLETVITLAVDPDFRDKFPPVPESDDESELLQVVGTTEDTEYEKNEKSIDILRDTLPLHISNPGRIEPVKCVWWAATPDNPCYRACLDDDFIAYTSARCRGESGPNYEYFIKLQDFLQNTGTYDPHLARIVQLIRQELAKPDFKPFPYDPTLPKKHGDYSSARTATKRSSRGPSPSPSQRTSNTTLTTNTNLTQTSHLQINSLTTPASSLSPILASTSGNMFLAQFQQQQGQSLQQQQLLQQLLQQQQQQQQTNSSLRDNNNSNNALCSSTDHTQCVLENDSKNDSNDGKRDIPQMDIPISPKLTINSPLTDLYFDKEEQKRQENEQNEQNDQNDQNEQIEHSSDKIRKNEQHTQNQIHSGYNSPRLLPSRRSPNQTLVSSSNYTSHLSHSPSPKLLSALNSNCNLNPNNDNLNEISLLNNSHNCRQKNQNNPEHENNNNNNQQPQQLFTFSPSAPIQFRSQAQGSQTPTFSPLSSSGLNNQTKSTTNTKNQKNFQSNTKNKMNQANGINGIDVVEEMNEFVDQIDQIDEDSHHNNLQLISTSKTFSSLHSIPIKSIISTTPTTYPGSPESIESIESKTSIQSAPASLTHFQSLAIRPTPFSVIPSTASITSTASTTPQSNLSEISLNTPQYFTSQFPQHQHPHEQQHQQHQPSHFINCTNQNHTTEQSPHVHASFFSPPTSPPCGQTQLTTYPSTVSDKPTSSFLPDTSYCSSTNLPTAPSPTLPPQLQHQPQPQVLLKASSQSLHSKRNYSTYHPNQSLQLHKASSRCSGAPTCNIQNPHYDDYNSERQQSHPLSSATKKVLTSDSSSNSLHSLNRLIDDAPEESE